MRFVLLTFLLSSCATSWTDADTQANAIGVRSEARVLEMCAGDGGTECTPSRVRAFTLLSYCANMRELAAHGGADPDAGSWCR